MELIRICEQVITIATETGRFILGEQAKFTEASVEEKGVHNLVSYVDKTAEQKLVAALSKILPKAAFITEEETVEQNADAEYKWIIDPLDGTTNFIHGLPCYAVSIALAKNDVPVLGVLYEVNRAECFYAWQGGGAFMNGKPIHVSTRTKLNDSLLVTGFPYYDYGKLDQYLELFKYMMKNARGVRRLGSAATDMAYVACGRFEGFYEYGLSPWDVAAGIIIVQEAGGQIADFSGGSNYLFGKEMVCSNGLIQQEMMEAVGKFF